MVYLETGRLLFRDHIEADLEPYCQIESDPVYRGPQVVHPREELEHSFFNAWLIPKPLALRATVYKPESCYIGRCGLYPRWNELDEPIPGEATLAYYLARPYWGRGLATEAAEAFVKYGFEHLRLRKICAGANAENAASLRVLEKLGFHHVRSGRGGGSEWHDFELLPVNVRAEG